MRQVLVDHRLGVVSMSALSQSMPKSACAFPVISNASLVRSSSASRAMVRRRNFSSSTCSRLRLGRPLGSNADRDGAHRKSPGVLIEFPHLWAWSV